MAGSVVSGNPSFTLPLAPSAVTHTWSCVSQSPAVPDCVVSSPGANASAVVLSDSVFLDSPYTLTYTLTILGAGGQ